MVKKSKKTISSFHIPAPIAITSIAVNVVLLLTFVVSSVLDKNGTFDHMMVNSGVTKMCSKEFRKNLEKKIDNRGDSANSKGLQLALVDYPCTHHDAKPFYEKGYDDYVKSLGLNPNV